MTVTTARARQADRRREEILATSLRLFAEQGFHATTISDIARATGTAHGLVYHYFASKEGLLLEILERYKFVPELRSLLAVSPDRPAAVVLTAVALGFSQALSERSDLLRLVVRESQSQPQVAAALGTVMAEGTDLMTAYLEARIAAGELRPHDTTVTARAIFWAIVTQHLGPSKNDGFESALVDLLLDGIRAP